MEEILTYLFVLAWFLGPLLLRLIRGAKQRQQAAVEPSVDAAPLPAAPPHRVVRAPAAPRLTLPQVVEKLEASRAHALQLAKDARIELSTRRFVPPLEEFVVPELVRLLSEARGNNAPHPSGLHSQLQQLELVIGQLESFIVQRRHDDLAATLGDADAFAASCYEPFAEFARAHSIPLTSNTPATEFGYDLAIWTAFIPTGIAPISVPTDLFRRIAWWPALAHEIAHDVYSATLGFDEGVRQELGLYPAHVGAAPLRFTAQGLAASELDRVFSGWFEELFCDVFATLMCGPAYAWTMLELFGNPNNPMSVVQVRLDGSRRAYDEHPPRHLRMAAVCEIVEQIGHPETAAEIREAWTEIHHGRLDAIFFPGAGQYFALRADALEAIAVQLAAKLYMQPLKALAGYRLRDVPGLDFGPHLSAESERVRDRLLAGAPPNTTNARAVIAGAVLAWLHSPDDERKLIELARQSIKAKGTFEAAPDRYAPPPPSTRDDRREAFILHTILAPPRALARARGRPSLLARPSA